MQIGIAYLMDISTSKNGDFLKRQLAFEIWELDLYIYISSPSEFSHFDIPAQYCKTILIQSSMLNFMSKINYWNQMQCNIHY